MAGERDHRELLARLKGIDHDLRAEKRKTQELASKLAKLMPVSQNDMFGAFANDGRATCASPQLKQKCRLSLQHNFSISLRY